MLTVIAHPVPAIDGRLNLVMHSGSTCYDLTADNMDSAGADSQAVTVYLSFRTNQGLMAIVGDTLNAMSNRTPYTSVAMTDAGVTDLNHPQGEITVEYDSSSTYAYLTVDDKHGGSVTVLLNQSMVESLLLGCARMVGHF